jgi:arylsulfatase A-like enzyme
VGAYGASVVQTPALDRIASEGVRLDQFHIAAFACCPSRATLLTGRYSHNHGVIENDIPLDHDTPTLGTLLTQAGYRTGYVGKWHLDGNMYRGIPGAQPFSGNWKWQRVADEANYRYEKVEGGTGEDEAAPGWQYWVGGWRHYRDYLRSVDLGGMIEELPWLGIHNIAPSGPDGTHAYSRVPEEHHMSAFLRQRAVEFLDGHAGGPDPFALVLSFYGPHHPVAPPAPWHDAYNDAAVELPDNVHDRLENKPVNQAHHRGQFSGDWSLEQLRDYTRRYWGYCSYIDRQIGEVLDALEQGGVLEDTIVVFTSDHGDMVAGHGMVHKLVCCGYDELMRVPFLIRWPKRLPQGRTSPALVSSVDLLPTLAELMGLPLPDAVDGRSFAGLLTAETETHRDIVFTSSCQRNTVATTADWKYNLNWGFAQARIDELYNRREDPGELDNRINTPEVVEVVDRLQARVREWLEETGFPYTHTVAAAMAAPQPLPVPVFPVRLENLELKVHEPGHLQIRYDWVCTEDAPAFPRLWSFLQFIGPGDQIAFRRVEWPETETTEWRKGDRHPIGPLEEKLPDTLQPGTYAVRIGLYDPEQQRGPRLVGEWARNFLQPGVFRVEKTADGRLSGHFQPVAAPQ